VSFFRVVHETRYAYGAPVSLGHHLAHLTPRDTDRQTCRASVLVVDPTPGVRRERVDFFGNRVAYFAVETLHERLTVRAESEVEVLDRPPALATGGEARPWEAVRATLWEREDFETLTCRQFAFESPLVPLDDPVRDYAAASFGPGRDVVGAVQDLMGRIHRDFTYDPGFTTVSTPLSQVLAHRRGVCQDLAHLAIACVRAQGLAVRYVSGYLETAPAPGQARLTGADASHAWFSVYVPDAGWLDFDPTNNQVPLDRHITLAWGRDYADVAPLKGVLYGGGAHALAVAVTVERLEQAPTY
jgi:transglutaminase-like putative cysteine protease